MDTWRNGTLSVKIAGSAADTEINPCHFIAEFSKSLGNFIL